MSPIACSEPTEFGFSVLGWTLSSIVCVIVSVNYVVFSVLYSWCVYVECVVGHSICVGSSFINGVWENTSIIVLWSDPDLPPPQKSPKWGIMGGEMNTRSSMSLSFIESHAWVGVLSFASVRFMLLVFPLSRVLPEVRVLFPKLSCLLLNSPVSMTLPRPKHPLQNYT